MHKRPRAYVGWCPCIIRVEVLQRLRAANGIVSQPRVEGACLSLPATRNLSGGIILATAVMLARALQTCRRYATLWQAL